MSIHAVLKEKLQDGPIPLSDYMATCLYDMNHGYYTIGIPIGAQGDFTTAPEISQLFGEMMALWALDYAKDKRHNLIDYGAGKGTLLADVARIAKKYDALDYFCIEVSPSLKAIQQKSLIDTNCQWFETVDQAKAAFGNNPSIFIANELLDAVPIDQYVYANNKWHKRYVALEKGAYVYKDILSKTPPTELLKHYPDPQEGDVLECSPQQEQLFMDMLRGIKANGGAVACIDYGYTNYAYGDTVQALKNHKPVSVLDHQGHADLTSHVNFAYYADIAKSQGCEVTLYTQAEFLKMMGVDLRCEILCKQFPDQEKILREGLDRLVNKMGYLFKVLIIKSNEKST